MLGRSGAARGSGARGSVSYGLRELVACAALAAACKSHSLSPCESAVNCAGNEICVDGMCRHAILGTDRVDGESTDGGLADGWPDDGFGGSADVEPSDARSEPDASIASDAPDDALGADDGTTDASEGGNGVGDAMQGDASGCVDGDGDGYGAGCEAPDCDDTREAIHPGAVEACNGVDDDCDGAVDDGVIRPCESEFCGEGVQACVTGAWGACSAGAPVPEVCNGLDDDCDGTIDEGAYAPSTASVGTRATGGLICGPGGEDDVSGVRVENDGAETALAFEGASGVLVDDVGVSACVVADFGAILDAVSALRVVARTADSACGATCATWCGENTFLAIFTSTTGASWSHLYTLDALGEARASYTVPIAEAMRFAMLCRTSIHPSRGHVAVDFVEARLCP